MSTLIHDINFEDKQNAKLVQQALNETELRTQQPLPPPQMQTQGPRNLAPQMPPPVPQAEPPQIVKPPAPQVPTKQIIHQQQPQIAEPLPIPVETSDTLAWLPGSECLGALVRSIDLNKMVILFMICVIFQIDTVRHKIIQLVGQGHVFACGVLAALNVAVYILTIYVLNKTAML